MSERPTTAPNHGVPLLIALVVGFLGGAGALSLALGGRSTPTRQLPQELTAFVPIGVRGVILADVERLRAAPVLAPLLAAPLASEPCETRLLRQVRRVLVVFGGSFDEIGFAFEGTAPREALVACARSRGGSHAEVTASRRDGIDRVRIAPAAHDDFLPPSHTSEIVYLPRGTVLAGSTEMVHRMFDQARAGDVLGDDAPTALDALRSRLGAGHDVVGALALVPSDLGSLESEPALRHVIGLAIGVRVTTTVQATALVACDSYDAPRDVADALDRLRAAVATQIPALAGALHEAVIERRATDVRVTVTLSPEALSALANLN